MSSLTDKLSKLESRIQSLVERDSTPSLSNTGNFGSKMVAAMNESLREDESGGAVTADLYIVTVDQETAHLLMADPSLVDQISQSINQAANDSGVKFTVPPRVKINSEPSFSPGDFEISAQYSLQEVDDTSTLTIAGNEGIELPEYAFLIINGVQVFPLDEAVVNIGRRSDNHVVIEDMRVSRVHAQIRAVKGHYMVFDLDSSGGTFVNGVRTHQVTLYPGDVISLAGVDLVYGQDAAYLSGDSPGSTQPLVPFPEQDQ